MTKDVNEEQEDLRTEGLPFIRYSKWEIKKDVEMGFCVLLNDKLISHHSCKTRQEAIISALSHPLVRAVVNLQKQNEKLIDILESIHTLSEI